MNGAQKKKATPMDKLMTAIVVLVIAVFVAAGVYATYGKISEGISNKAIEDGKAEETVSYLAKQDNMSVEDYLAQYGLTLGDTIKKNTTLSEMLDNMTLENYAKYIGQDIDAMIESAGLGDKVTKDTLWKDARPLLPLISYYGEEQLNQIKQIYGFGDEVTPDMTYGDFEKLVEEKQAEMAQATEAPADDEQTTDAEETEPSQAPEGE